MQQVLSHIKLPPDKRRRHEQTKIIIIFKGIYHIDGKLIAREQAFHAVIKKLSGSYLIIQLRTFFIMEITNIIILIEYMTAINEI